MPDEFDDIEEQIERDRDAKRRRGFRQGQSLQRGIDRYGKPRIVTFIRYIYVSGVGRMAMIEYRKPRKLELTQEVCFIQDLRPIKI